MNITNLFFKNNINNNKLDCGNIYISICDFNKLQIYANPSIYIIKILIDNYNDEIIYDFEDIEINVNTCDSNQIKLYDTNNILYCEEPICRSSCPVDESASCMPSNEKPVNDINNNICVCYNGWEGNNCENKIYVDFKKEKIIKDTGFYKILLVCVGISLMFSIYYIYIVHSYILGNDIKNKVNKNKSNIFLSNSFIENFEKNNKSKNKNNQSPENTNNIININNNSSNCINEKKLSSVTFNMNKSSIITNLNKELTCEKMDEKARDEQSLAMEKMFIILKQKQKSAYSAIGSLNVLLKSMSYY
ncbi:hypothetical protein PIROE2DRAFT_2623 [Piromyces sp. E2]|nr:hypothetical protein PIROE2DRAFT_2623 [Piromyces sp. E2]|eukprot:OUM69525.1 hypothetical protein PIROE2DRAFT_2623 [Piromyces sp. E2]